MPTNKRDVEEVLAYLRDSTSKRNEHQIQTGTGIELATLETVLQHLLMRGLVKLDSFDPSKRGAADISFVAPYTDGLAGLGAVGSGHAEAVEAATAVQVE